MFQNMHDIAFEMLYYYLTFATHRISHLMIKSKTLFERTKHTHTNLSYSDSTIKSDRQNAGTKQ